MSEKRKDNKGRILRTGESQRKDLIYQYRYTDIRGKRQTVYSSDLKELREKEKEIQKQLDDGIDYAAGKINVIQLLEMCIRDRVFEPFLNGEFWLHNGVLPSNFCPFPFLSISVEIRVFRRVFLPLGYTGEGYIFR